MTYPGVAWGDIARTIWITAVVLGAVTLMTLLWDFCTVRSAQRVTPSRLGSLQPKEAVPFRARLSKAIHPSRSRTGRLIEALNVFLSLCQIVLYMATSYSQEPDTGSTIAVIVFNTYFMLRYLLYMWLTEPGKRLTYVLSFEPIVNIITVCNAILPITNAVDTFLTFTYLRVVNVYESYANLDMWLAPGLFCTQVQRQIVRISILAASFIFCMGCTVLTLERAGEISTAFGNLVSHEWYMWNSIYWAVVTVTTVGYGDITPITSLGRLFTVLFLLGGVILFSVLFSRLADLMQTRSAGHAAFINPTRKLTVLLTGDTNRTQLLEVLSELFHPERLQAQQHLHAVIMLDASAYNNEDQTFFSLHPFYRTVASYLQGSVFHYADLVRACAHRSETQAAFILTQTSCKDDTKNLLRVLALRRLVPSLPLYIMLNNSFTRQHLLALGITDDCMLCADMIKYGLVAANVVTPGAAPLLLNLFCRESAYNLYKTRSKTRSGPSSRLDRFLSWLRGGACRRPAISESAQSHPVHMSEKSVPQREADRVDPERVTIGMSDGSGSNGVDAPSADGRGVHLSTNGVESPASGGHFQDNVLVQSATAIFGSVRLLAETFIGTELAEEKSLSLLASSDFDVANWKWQEEYAEGVGQEIYEVKCPSWLVGKSMLEATCILFCSPLAKVLLSPATRTTLRLERFEDAMEALGCHPDLINEHGALLVALKRSRADGTPVIECDLRTNCRLTGDDALFIVLGNVSDRVTGAEMIEAGLPAIVCRLLSDYLQRNSARHAGGMRANMMVPERPLISRPAEHFLSAPEQQSPPVSSEEMATAAQQQTPDVADTPHSQPPADESTLHPLGNGSTHRRMAREQPNPHHAIYTPPARLHDHIVVVANTGLENLHLFLYPLRRVSASPVVILSSHPIDHWIAIVQEMKRRRMMSDGDFTAMQRRSERGHLFSAAAAAGTTSDTQFRRVSHPHLEDLINEGHLLGSDKIVPQSSASVLPSSPESGKEDSEHAVDAINVASAFVQAADGIQAASNGEKNPDKLAPTAHTAVSSGKNLSRVYYVQGDSLVAADLQRAHVPQAARVIIFRSGDGLAEECTGGDHPPVTTDQRFGPAAWSSGEDSGSAHARFASPDFVGDYEVMADAKSILTTMLLESRLSKTAPALVASITTELVNRSSILLLGPAPHVAKLPFAGDEPAPTDNLQPKQYASKADNEPSSRGKEKPGMEVRCRTPGAFAGSLSGAGTASQASMPVPPDDAPVPARQISPSGAAGRETTQTRSAGYLATICVGRKPVSGVTTRPATAAAAGLSLEAGKRAWQGFKWSARYAAGRLFPVSSIHSLLAQSFYNPSLLRLAQMFARGDQIRLQHRLTPADLLHSSQCPHMPAADAFLHHRDDQQKCDCMPTYASVYLRMVTIHKVAPLGLFRDNRWINSLFPYVHTNPRLASLVRPGDLMFVVVNVHSREHRDDNAGLPSTVPQLHHDYDAW